MILRLPLLIPRLINQVSTFIKFVELLTGKLLLKRLYDQYLSEDNPPKNFWDDALKKLQINLISHYHCSKKITQNSRLK
jgi:hypothetical protein